MAKFRVYLLILVVSMLIAGLYGILHNQISYTVSPEYFTKFKFRTFGLVESRLPARILASIVGFLASWWMGIPIGLLVGGMGFIQSEPARMLRVSLKALVVVVGVALLVGLAGLACGWVQTTHIDVAEYRGWYIPDDVTDLRRFLCAGYMHNASYLGGVLGIPVAWAYQIVKKIRKG